jgi:hypothetical protein
VKNDGAACVEPVTREVAAGMWAMHRRLPDQQTQDEESQYIYDAPSQRPSGRFNGKPHIVLYVVARAESKHKQELTCEEPHSSTGRNEQYQRLLCVRV